MIDRLTARQLNRASLGRQMLLERSDVPVLDVLQFLVGMQAQVPHNPYTALWSRLRDFDPETLSQLLIERVVVRIVVMRGTIHLVTASDCLLLRPLAQPVLDAELARHPQFRAALDGVDLALVLAFVKPLLAARPRSGPELRSLFAEQFPTTDSAALTYACRNHLALVQVPPRGLWRRGGQVTSTTAEAWLGRRLVAKPRVDDVVLRYFGAFGPASVADLTTWSRFTGCREIVERLRPKLRVYIDPAGREVYDVADRELVDVDTPAPARVLPEYDNALLGYADRSRFASDDGRRQVPAINAVVHGTMLIDGLVRATWTLERDKATRRGSAQPVRMIVRHDRLPKAQLAAMAFEANAYLDFIEPDATSRDVVLEQG